MEYTWTEKPAPPERQASVFWWLVTGVPIGLLFLIAVQLDKRWFVFLFLAILLLAISFTTVDRKAFFLILLVLAIPIKVHVNFMFQRSTIHHPTYGFQILLYTIPLLLLYAIWGLRCLVSRAPFTISTRGLLPLSAFFAVAFLSVLKNGNLLFGAFDLFSLLESVILFIYVSSDLRSKWEIQVVVAALLTVVGIQGLIAVGQHVTDSTLGLEFLGATKSSVALSWQGLFPLTRVSGTLGDPNVFALFLDLLIPLGFGLLFCPLKGRTKLLLGVAVGFGVLGLVLSLSRGGLFSTGAGCLLILCIWLKRRVGLFRGLLVVVVAIALVLVVTFGTSNPVQKRFFRDDYQAAFSRIPLLQVALNVIRAHPFFGIGLNNYNEVAPRYDNTRERIMFRWNIPVHNELLYIAAEIGLVGLFFFLVFLAVIFRGLWPALSDRDPFVAWAGLGIFAGMLVFLAHLQTEFISLTRDAMPWFISGLAVSLGRLAIPSPAESTREHGSQSR